MADLTLQNEVLGDKEIRTMINALPKINQRQYSTKAQLIQLIDIARKLGLYDAQDTIQKLIGMD